MPPREEAPRMTLGHASAVQAFAKPRCASRPVSRRTSRTENRRMGEEPVEAVSFPTDEGPLVRPSQTANSSASPSSTGMCTGHNRSASSCSFRRSGVPRARRRHLPCPARSSSRSHHIRFDGVESLDGGAVSSANAAQTNEPKRAVTERHEQSTGAPEMPANAALTSTDGYGPSWLAENQLFWASARPCERGGAHQRVEGSRPCVGGREGGVDPPSRCAAVGHVAQPSTVLIRFASAISAVACAAGIFLPDCARTSRLNAVRVRHAARV